MLGPDDARELGLGVQPVLEGNREAALRDGVHADRRLHGVLRWGLRRHQKVPRSRTLSQIIRPLGHLGIEGVSAVRVGRRIELTVAAVDEITARATVERLASELLSNPLIEAYTIEAIGAASSTVGAPA